jgi:la-related protein 1
VNSGTTTPAPTPAPAAFAELESSNGNWADDVENATTPKTDGHEAAVPEQPKVAPVKETAVERTKSESRVASGSSGVSSPNMAVTPSTTTTTDDSSSAPNTTTSSETTWETKSQGSEPAWIAERKERQTHDDKDEKSDERPPRRGGKKGGDKPNGDKESKDSAAPKPEPKPVVYTDAAPPAVNPWAKRMEETKPKAVAVPLTPRPATTSVATPAPAPVKENSRPEPESRKKTNSVTSIPRESEVIAGTEKPSGSQGKRPDPRNHARQASKPAAETTRPEWAPTAPKHAPRESQSSPHAGATPVLVKDETSWPTPDKAEKLDDKDRKEGAGSVVGDKDTDANGDGDGTDAKHPREKTKWTPFAVTPTIVWETEEMNRRGSGERGGRGAASSRGRGGFRGAPNGTKGGDRAGTRKETSQGESESTHEGHRGPTENTDRGATIPTSKPTRLTGANDPREGGHARGQSQAHAVSNTAGGETGTGSVVPPSLPAKMEAADGEGQDGKASNGPPRHPVCNGPTTGSREGSEGAREPPTKRLPDNKRDSRNFDSYNGKEWNGAPRGGKRGGRGRGGSREFTNSHQANAALVNGHADYPNSYPVPHSPSAFQPGRGGFGYTQQGRAGWRGNPRSQSIPVENVYGPRAGYGAPSQLPPMHTYFPGMYNEFNGVPLTAMPYNPVAEHQYLMEMVTTQLDYYFSVDNLLKDMFLRRNMDSQGFVFLDVIANFNRIKQFNAEREMLKAACLKSEVIEIKIGDDGRERLRKSEGWDHFLLPMDQREASAQNDGPQNPRRPEVPPLQIWSPPLTMPYRGPASAGLSGPQQRRSHDSGHLMNGAVAQFAPGLPEMSLGDLPNGDESRGRASQSPIPGTNPALSAGADEKPLEPDVFPDDHASTLTVVVKMSPSKTPHAAARTFSNGSIDTRSIFTEMEKSTDDASKMATNGDYSVNGEAPTPNISRHASPSLGRSPEKGENGVSKDLTLLWVKNSEMPQEKLPQDATLEPYLQLRLKALSQREQAATGTCPYDLDVLYQFWSHFLIRNFNSRMYGEFKYYAGDDAQARHNGIGMQNLVQFYAKALTSSNPIRDHIVKDYVELVKSEPSILQGLGFKQLRQAWRNGALNLKNRKKLADIIDEELRARLES